MGGPLYKARINLLSRALKMYVALCEEQLVLLFYFQSVAARLGIVPLVVDLSFTETALVCESSLSNGYSVLWW